MRKVERIDEFTEKMAKLWKEYVPDWRFGQLMFNFLSTIGDPFYLEEDEFIAKLEEYVKNNSPYNRG